MDELQQIFLSPPDMGETERTLLLEAFDSNWIAPLGPHVDAFEEEFANFTGTSHAVALSSGTAALHLGLIALGVSSGDEVVVPTMTFAATAFAVRYVGATPVFVDSERNTWNIDPALLEELLLERASRGALPAAIIPVDLYGECANYDEILDIADRFEVPVLEDAAEALGATWNGRPAGGFGAGAAFSFNGNKIMTTSGGGMFVTDDAELAQKVRHLSTQARMPVAHYEHEEVGYNYRLSNLLAAVGRGQLGGLPTKIERRHEVRERYERELGRVKGLSFQPQDPRGRSNAWLTVICLDPAEATATPNVVIETLMEARIEARNAWKPMHLQPVFSFSEHWGGAVAEEVFHRGVCLPSGSALTEKDQQRVVDALFEVLG